MNKPAAHDVEMREGNCELKKTVGEGFALQQLITEDVLQACERQVKAATDSFFTLAAPTIEPLIRLLERGESLKAQGTLLHYTTETESLAKTLGFQFIGNLCHYIARTFESQKISEEKKLALLAELGVALQLAFSQRMEGSGGIFGQELSAKFAHL